MLIYGRNSVYEYLENNQVKKLYVLNKFKDNKIDKYFNKVPVKFIDRLTLDKMVDGNHQGIIAEIEDFKYSDLSEVINNKDNSILIILDHIEDPHNFGAIIRTSEAAGVDGIIIPNKRSVEVNSTVIKTSVGAISNIPIVMVSNINQTIETLKNNDYWIVGTDMDGESYTNIDYKGKVAIVIGNEGNGISELVRKNCDFIASIPMVGKINSLNASVASGIMIYEVLRQQMKG